MTDIWVVNADGSNDVAVTTSVQYAQSPAWSPDGSKFAITYWDGQNLGIGTINVDGSGLRKLTATPCARHGFGMARLWVSQTHKLGKGGDKIFGEI